MCYLISLGAGGYVVHLYTVNGPDDHEENSRNTVFTVQG